MECPNCSNCKSIKLVPVHVIDAVTDSQWSAAISDIDEYYSRHPDRFTR